MELRHGTDKAYMIELLRNGEKINYVIQPELHCRYFPAMPGDILRSTRSTEKWEHVVTKEDTKRGYVVYGDYPTKSYGARQFSVVFIVARKAFSPGAADRPCISIW